MFKENILYQVQEILKSVESIVSQVSSYSESNQDCHCHGQDDMWWDHQQVKETTFLYSDYELECASQSEIMSDIFFATGSPLADMTSPYNESALVAAISQEKEVTMLF